MEGLFIPVGLAPDAMSGMCSPEGPRRIEGYAAKTRGRISNTSVTQHSVIGTDASYLGTAGYGGQAGGEFRVRGPNCDDRLPEVWPVYLYTVSRVGTRLTPAYTYSL